MKSVHFTLCCLPRKDSSHSRGGSTRSSASDTRLSTEGCKHFYRASAVKRVLARSAICYGSVSVRPSVCHKLASYQTVSTCHDTNTSWYLEVFQTAEVTVKVTQGHCPFLIAYWCHSATHDFPLVFRCNYVFILYPGA